MFQEESFRKRFWESSCEDSILVGTIETVKSHEYIGYCAIKNMLARDWEISVEILKKWQRQGIGFCAVKAFLNAIAIQLQVNCFRVRIAADNFASQALFEKLGARPNGVSKFLFYDDEEIQKVEEKIRIR